MMHGKNSGSQKWDNGGVKNNLITGASSEQNDGDQLKQQKTTTVMAMQEEESSSSRIDPKVNTFMDQEQNCDNA